MCCMAINNSNNSTEKDIQQIKQMVTRQDRQIKMLEQKTRTQANKIRTLEGIVEALKTKLGFR